MKGGVAMMISTMLRLKMEEIVPAGDIIFMALSDEENNGFFGALYMVDVHSDLFDGVRYALGEFGGSNIRVAGTRFYPIQVAEKQYCSIRATVHGPGGHAATIISENAIDKTAKVLDRINNRRMPVHITPPLRIMIEEMAKGVGFPANFVLRLLLNPMLTDFLLNWFGEIGLTFLPMFHNTVNATIIRGGDKMNVIPCDVELKLDGRILPGLKPEQLLAELRDLIAFGEDDVDLEVLYYEMGSEKVDMGLFDMLADVLREMDLEGMPIPLLLPYVTDGRHLAKLGIQSYGFIPMRVPDDFEFFKLAHAEDERVPVKALKFGVEGLYRAIIRYTG
jgi:acetylornithine deacetylase/succinyl-diaminopimelate desuccinylase-like protein